MINQLEEVRDILMNEYNISLSVWEIKKILHILIRQNLIELKNP